MFIHNTLGILLSCRPLNDKKVNVQININNNYYYKTVEFNL